MKTKFWRLSGLLLILLAGCTRTSTPPAGTGARDAVQRFYDAVIQRDWPKAYACLHPDNTKGLSVEQFARLGEAYRRNLGFEPTLVQIRSCEEQGDQAIAHIVLSGRTHHQKPHYRDGLSLRQCDTQWCVVLPQNFGRPTK